MFIPFKVFHLLIMIFIFNAMSIEGKFIFGSRLPKQGYIESHRKMKFDREILVSTADVCSIRVSSINYFIISLSDDHLLIIISKSSMLLMYCICRTRFLVILYQTEPRALRSMSFHLNATSQFIIPLIHAIWLRNRIS